MNIMLVDTAAGTRVYLSANGAEYFDEDLKNAGSKTLMPMIDGLLKKAGIAVGDVDAFGACVGPGSFTGIRIGLTTVKTMCYALGKSCFAVNALRLNSYNNMEKGKVISLADAGNGVCYVARYHGDIELDPPVCMRMEDAKKYIAAHPDHAVSTDQKLSAALGGRWGVGLEQMRYAASVHSAELIDQKDLTPLYIRKSQPERGEGDL